MFTSRQLTDDGIERTWALNHLAPFLLTTLLLDRLKASAPARIITTSSDAHKGKLIPFDDLNAERSWKGRGFTRYGETKLANIMFTRELARRLEGTGVTAYSFHPGLVATGFNRNNGALMSAAMTIIAPFSRSPRKAAQTLVWLADSPDVSKQSGGYYEDRALAVSSRQAQDPTLARRLWEISEEQVRPKRRRRRRVPDQCRPMRRNQGMRRQASSPDRTSLRTNSLCSTVTSSRSRRTPRAVPRLDGRALRARGPATCRPRR